MEEPSTIPKCCLICNQDVEETKPVFGEDAEHIVSQFWISFQCFCELLGVGEIAEKGLNEVINQVIGIFQEKRLDGDVEVISVKSSPCCPECTTRLEEIVRIKNTIEELKVSLRKNVDGLRNSLLENSSSAGASHDDWFLVRKQIYSFIPETFRSSPTLDSYNRQRQRSKPIKSKKPGSSSVTLDKDFPQTAEDSISRTTFCNEDNETDNPETNKAEDAVIEKYKDLLRPCSVKLDRRDVAIFTSRIRRKQVNVVEDKSSSSNVAKRSFLAISKKILSPIVPGEDAAVSSIKRKRYQDSPSQSVNVGELDTNDLDSEMVDDLHPNDCMDVDSEGTKETLSTKSKLSATRSDANDYSESSTERLKCHYCDESYKRKQNLQRHHKRLHRGKPIVYPDLMQSNTKRRQKRKFRLGPTRLRRHVPESEVPLTECSRFVCVYCDESYKNKKGLEKHHERLHSEKPLISSKIELRKPVSRYEALTKNMTEEERLEWEKTRFKCLHCGITCRSKQSLIKHETFQHPGKEILIPERGPRQIGRINKNFWLVNEDTLLYKFTLIQILCAGNQLACLQQKCSFAVTDDENCSPQELFQRMTAHIDSKHSVLVLETDETQHLPSLKCPVHCCAEEFLPYQQRIYREHILTVHKIVTAICDICWKPMRYYQQSFQLHMSSHQSPEERLQEEKTSIQEENVSMTTSSGGTTGACESESRPTRSCTKKSIPISKLLAETDKIVDGEDIDDDYQPSGEESDDGHEDEIGDTANDKNSTIIEKRGKNQDKNESQFKCQFCGVSFKSKNSRRRHTVRFHRDDYLPEDLDYDDNLNTFRIARSEAISHLPDKNLLIYKFTLFQFSASHDIECLEPGCSTIIPGNDYISLQDFKEHVTVSHFQQNHPDQKNSYIKKTRKCFLCPPETETFPTGNRLRQHLLAGIHGNCPHRCDSCGKSIQSSNALKDHEWSHKSPEEKELCQPPKSVITRRPGGFVCQHCGRTFSTEHNLKQHVLCHDSYESRAKWLCSECPSKFQSAVGLRLHLQRLHSKGDESLYKTCPYCNVKIFHRDGTRFRRHVKSHITKEKDHTCDKCGVSFWNYGDLKRHDKWKHQNHRSYNCAHCEESYKYPSNLRRHLLKTHPDQVQDELATIKPKNLGPLQYRPEFYGPKIAFPCEICEKVFPLRSRMTKHVKMYHKTEYETGLIKLE